MRKFAYEKSFEDARLLENEVSELKAHGWSVFGFPTEISGKKEIFDYIRNTFPLDPPLGRGNSWDALSDSIGGGLEAFRDSGIAIIVRYSSRSEISPAAMELIDVLFCLKESQLFESMRMYCYRPKDAAVDGE